MRLYFAGVVLSGLGLSVLACQSDYTMYPGIEGCDTDAGHCNNAAGGGVVPGAGGSTSASSTSGVGGATAATTLLGGVDIITAPTFQDTGTPYSGAANIVAVPQAGGTITTMFTGGSGATFELLDMPAGNAWILVQDTSGGAAGILSTYSGPVGTPNPAQITVPVLSSQLLTNIASNLPGALIGGVSPLAAQVVLVVTHGGAPYQGLTVSGGAGSAHVVYDIGPGSYSDTTTATSTGGTIVLLNLGTLGAATISLTDTTTMAVVPVTILTAANAATLVYLGL